ncbi:conserved hypothetical protein [Ricinus communis]|uniref:Transmembrane protein n=1 Tax=Ricinus communis TaxID=3988 RepID=B9R751_RICCO|nr:conserved hypothetical protein [Ricinus communis]
MKHTGHTFFFLSCIIVLLLVLSCFTKVESSRPLDQRPPSFSSSIKSLNVAQAYSGPSHRGVGHISVAYSGPSPGGIGHK